MPAPAINTISFVPKVAAGPAPAVELLTPIPRPPPVVCVVLAEVVGALEPVVPIIVVPAPIPRPPSTEEDVGVAILVDDGVDVIDARLDVATPFVA